MYSFSFQHQEMTRQTEIKMIFNFIIRLFFIFYWIIDWNLLTIIFKNSNTFAKTHRLNKWFYSFFCDNHFRKASQLSNMICEPNFLAALENYLLLHNVQNVWCLNYCFVHTKLLSYKRLNIKLHTYLWYYWIDMSFHRNTIDLFL